MSVFTIPFVGSVCACVYTCMYTHMYACMYMLHEHVHVKRPRPASSPTEDMASSLGVSSKPTRGRLGVRARARGRARRHAAATQWPPQPRSHPPAQNAPSAAHLDTISVLVVVPCTFLSTKAALCCKLQYLLLQVSCSVPSCAVN